MGVNASGCAPKKVTVPDQDPGGWSEPLGTATGAPSADEVPPPSGSARWRSGLGRAASGPLALGDSVIVGMAVDRNLSVLERETGDRLWRKRLNAPGSSGPLLDGDRLFVATGGADGRVFSFSLAGKKRWERPLGPVRGPLAVVGGLVFAATERGGVAALEAPSGEPRWTRRLSQASRAGVVAHDGDLLVATDDSLFRLSQHDGSVTGRSALPGTTVAPPAWQGDTLVLATADGQVLALDAVSLSTLWTVDVNGAVFGGPTIARDSAFVVTLRGDVWSIPLGDPARARAMPVGAAVRAPTAPVRTGVLIGTLSGEILLVRGDSVTRQGRVEGPIEQPIIVRDGTMYVLDGRGRIHAWR